MKKILLATEKPFSRKAIDVIRDVIDSAGYELVLLENYQQPQQLLDAVVDVDALIVRSDKVTSEVIDAAKKLQIVVRAGAGYDNLDLEACTKKNIVAMNTPGQNSNAVAELAFGMMIYLIRKQFNGGVGSELRGKSLGIHAYGNVGYYIGQIAHGFDMKVYGYDPYVSPDRMQSKGIEPLFSAEELYKTCEFISLHIPANAATIKSVNKLLLGLMPENAVLVNTARKEVIDEQELLELMEERPDFSYISDIAPSNADLLKSKFPDRCFFTPKKMGAQTFEANMNAGLAAARQVISYFTTGNETYKVNI